MNVKKVLFFAFFFSLLFLSTLFAKKATETIKNNETVDIAFLQSTLWEVTEIDEDIYPISQEGILMHMYFIFSNDGNMYIGCKFEQGKENVLGFANKSLKYELKGKKIILADNEAELILNKNTTVTIKEKGNDGGKIILQAVNSPSIDEIKNAQTIDIGDIFNDESISY